MIPATIRFGRQPHDPQRLAAVSLRAAAAARAPLEYPTPLAPWTPTLAMNTVLPTCGVAGLANSARRWAASQGFDLTIPDQKLFDLYAAVAGCAPTPEAIAATDGIVLLDLLQIVAANGFDYGGPSPLALTAYRIDTTDLNAMREANAARASVYLGVMLYECDVVPGLTAWRGAPSGAQAGRHCICGFRYGADLFGEATWGCEMDADDAWVAGRVEEAYSIAWQL